MSCCTDHKTDLTSNSNISKTVRVNIALTKTIFKEYLVSFTMILRLTYFALAVLRLLMFKVFGNIGISKIEFFNFSGTEMVKNTYFEEHLRTAASEKRS